MIIELLNTGVVSHVKQEKIKKNIYEWLYENVPVMQQESVFTYDYANNILSSDKIILSSLTLKSIPFHLNTRILNINCVKMENFGNSIKCELLHFVNCNNFDFSSISFDSLKALTLYHCANACVDSIVSIRNISDEISFTSNSSFVDFSNYVKLGLLPNTQIKLDISSKHIIHIKNILSLLDHKLLYKSIKISNYASMDMLPKYLSLFRMIELYTHITNRSEYVMDFTLDLIENDFESLL